MAVLAPEEELTYYAAQKSGGLTMLLVILLVCAIGLAVLLSRRYLAPVLKGLEQIKQGGTEDFTPTNVPEIDDLLVYLAEQEQARQQAAGASIDIRETPSEIVTAYERFLQNLKTLSTAERSVFNLYLDGKTAQEIAEELFITINTVKFHNGNIYKKLGVSSLKELKVYMGMMKTREGSDGAE